MYNNYGNIIWSNIIISNSPFYGNLVLFWNILFIIMFYLKTSDCENMTIQSSTFSKIYGTFYFSLCDSFFEINLKITSFTKLNSHSFCYLTNCEKTTNENSICSRNNFKFYLARYRYSPPHLIRGKWILPKSFSIKYFLMVI